MTVRDHFLIEHSHEQKETSATNSLEEMVGMRSADVSNETRH